MCIRLYVSTRFKRWVSECIHSFSSVCHFVYSVRVFTISHRVVITVYKGISPLSFIVNLCACIIIVSVSVFRLLGERFDGNLSFGVGF